MQDEDLAASPQETLNRVARPDQHAIEAGMTGRAGPGGLHILIVDDHALFADGLTMLLDRLADQVCVSWSQSCEAALDGPLAGRPLDLTLFDLILFDLALPGTRHLEAYRLLAARAPSVPIVAVSADERPQMINDLLQAGAHGYIPKSSGSEVMLNALKLVLSGARYVPDILVRDGPLRAGANGLTARERQVLALLVAGHGNKAIASELDIAESTVRVHVTSILRRFGVRSRAALLTLPAVGEQLRGHPD
ncbi:MAG: response regulator transcription factor [Burkholderiaceae bacterium]